MADYIQSNNDSANLALYATLGVGLAAGGAALAYRATRDPSNGKTTKGTGTAATAAGSTTATAATGNQMGFLAKMLGGNEVSAQTKAAGNTFMSTPTGVTTTGGMGVNIDDVVQANPGQITTKSGIFGKRKTLQPELSDFSEGLNFTSSQNVSGMSEISTPTKPTVGNAPKSKSVGEQFLNSPTPLKPGGEHTVSASNLSMQNPNNVQTVGTFGKRTPVPFDDTISELNFTSSQNIANNVNALGQKGATAKVPKYRSGRKGFKGFKI